MVLSLPDNAVRGQTSLHDLRFFSVSCRHARSEHTAKLCMGRLFCCVHSVRVCDSKARLGTINNTRFPAPATCSAIFKAGKGFTRTTGHDHLAPVSVHQSVTHTPQRLFLVRPEGSSVLSIQGLFWMQTETSQSGWPPVRPGQSWSPEYVVPKVPFLLWSPICPLRL